MWNLYRIPWNPYEICGIHVKYVESMWNTMESIWNMWNPYGILWNPCGIHVEYYGILWNSYGICGNHMEYYRIHVEYVESIWIPWKELWWIPPGFQRNIPWNIEIPWSFHME